MPDRFFASDAYKKLPWYTTSFFPLFYAALGKPFPETYYQALRDLQIRSQGEDGYLGDHVASHFTWRIIFGWWAKQRPKPSKWLRAS